MVHLGYGTWVRADRVYAVVPITDGSRGDGRRTLVHVEGLEEPLVASRSDRAIVTELEEGQVETPRTRRRPRPSIAMDQDELF
jgi:hypothetical protein